MSELNDAWNTTVNLPITTLLVNATDTSPSPTSLIDDNDKTINFTTVDSAISEPNTTVVPS